MRSIVAAIRCRHCGRNRRLNENGLCELCRRKLQQDIEQKDIERPYDSNQIGNFSTMPGGAIAPYDVSLYSPSGNVASKKRSLTKMADKEEIETYEDAIKAVQRSGLALQFVPEKHKTYELCELAVQEDRWALQSVPEKHKTYELCKLAVQKNGRVLQFVPEQHKTYELCKLAVQKNGWVLQFVPEQHKTYELCKLAVQKNGWALQFVPEKHKTYELCKLAVQQNVWSLQFVPEKHKTYELCMLAVQKNGLALQFVPEKLRDYKLYRLAVQSNDQSLHFVPEKYKEELVDLFLNSPTQQTTEKEIDEEKIRQQVQVTPKTTSSTLIFDLYALNFLRQWSIQTEDNLTDFLYNETIQKAKQYYLKNLDRELKEEVLTTQVPYTLSSQQYTPKLSNWYKKEDDAYMYNKDYIHQDPSYQDYINLFMFAPWAEDFGGPNWGKIAYLTQKLSSARNSRDIMHCIDTINNVAHNSGSILNKFDKIRETYPIILNAKASVNSLEIMYPHCSKDVKRLLREYMKYRRLVPAKQLRSLTKMADKEIWKKRPGQLETAKSMIISYAIEGWKREGLSNEEIKSKIDELLENMKSWSSKQIKIIFNKYKETYEKETKQEQKQKSQQKQKLFKEKIDQKIKNKQPLDIIEQNFLKYFKKAALQDMNLQIGDMVEFFDEELKKPRAGVLVGYRPDLTPSVYVREVLTKDIKKLPISKVKKLVQRFDEEIDKRAFLINAARWTKDEEDLLKRVYIKGREKNIPHNIIYRRLTKVLPHSWTGVKQHLEKMYNADKELSEYKYDHWGRERILDELKALYIKGEPISRLALPPKLEFQIANHSLPKAKTRNFEVWFDDFDEAIAEAIYEAGYERDENGLTDTAIQSIAEAKSYYRKREKLAHSWNHDEIIGLLKQAHEKGLPLTRNFFKQHGDIYKPLLGLNRSLEGLHNTIASNGWTWRDLVCKAVPEYVDFYNDTDNLKESTGEIRVRRFLEINNINHKRATRYDKIAVIEPNLVEQGYAHFVPDILIIDKEGKTIAICEVFGSIADSAASNVANIYRDKMEAKIQVYSNLPIPFIAIHDNSVYGCDLSDDKLRQKFRAFIEDKDNDN